MKNNITLFAAYLCFISLVAFIITVYDKIAAPRGGRRVPEAALFAVSLLGGSAVMYLTMVIIRHKTLHVRFMLGVPAIIVVQIIVASYVLTYTM